MGELIVLAERRADKSRIACGGRAVFFFDLASPFSYLAAERVERVVGGVEWIPAAGEPFGAPAGEDLAAVQAHAEELAHQLRLPLVWPESFPAPTPSAMRLAAHASETQAGGRFALAASRLAFCGGFDLEDPEILAEAAAAAGIGLRSALDAAADLTRDGQLHATSRGLLRRGIEQLPAIRIDRRWFQGDGAIAAAAAMLRSGGAPAVDGPLAPVG